MRGFHRGDQRNVRQSSTAVNYSRPGAFPSTIKLLRSHPLVAEYRAFVFAAPPFLLVEFLVRFRGPPSGSFLTDQMPWIGLSILLRQTSFFFAFFGRDLIFLRTPTSVLTRPESLLRENTSSLGRSGGEEGKDGIVIIFLHESDATPTCL